MGGGGSWGTKRATISLRVGPYVRADGSLVLCGAFQFRGGNAGGRSRAVMRAYSLFMNGRSVVRDFGWMTIVSSRRSSLVGADVACRAYPDVKVPKDAVFGLRLGKTRF